MSVQKHTTYIVILNWNNYSDTSKCINSLLNITDDSFRIIVVDNASNDNSGDKLKKEFPDLVHLQTEKNLGYAGGMNLGINYAIKNSADYILISNNDMIYTEKFFNPLFELIRSDNKIGIVCPKVLYMHDKESIYCAGGDFNFWRASGVAAFRNKNTKSYGLLARKISMAEGSSFLARREVFEKCGLIREDFFMYFEDLEFSDRVRKLYDIWYCPDAIVYHKGGAGTSWAVHSPLYYFYYTRNRYLYFSSFNFITKVYVQIYSIIISLLKLTSLLYSFFVMKESRSKDAMKKLIRANLLGTKILWRNN